MAKFLPSMVLMFAIVYLISEIYYYFFNFQLQFKYDYDTSIKPINKTIFTSGFLIKDSYMLNYKNYLNVPIDDISVLRPNIMSIWGPIGGYHTKCYGLKLSLDIEQTHKFGDFSFDSVMINSDKFLYVIDVRKFGKFINIYYNGLIIRQISINKFHYFQEKISILLENDDFILLHNSSKSKSVLINLKTEKEYNFSNSDLLQDDKLIFKQVDNNLILFSLAQKKFLFYKLYENSSFIFDKQIKIKIPENELKNIINAKFIDNFLFFITNSLKIFKFNYFENKVIQSLDLNSTFLFNSEFIYANIKKNKEEYELILYEKNSKEILKIKINNELNSLSDTLHYSTEFLNKNSKFLNIEYNQEYLIFIAIDETNKYAIYFYNFEQNRQGFIKNYHFFKNFVYGDKILSNFLLIQTDQGSILLKGIIEEQKYLLVEEILINQNFNISSNYHDDIKTCVIEARSNGKNYPMYFINVYDPYLTIFSFIFLMIPFILICGFCNLMYHAFI